MTTQTWPFKDPDEVLDYSIDWTKRLDGDTIASSTFFVADGTIVIDSNTFTATGTTVWLSGGTLDETNTITNRIMTAGTRIMDQSVRLKIKTK